MNALSAPESASGVCSTARWRVHLLCKSTRHLILATLLSRGQAILALELSTLFPELEYPESAAAAVNGLLGDRGWPQHAFFESSS